MHVFSKYSLKSIRVEKINNFVSICKADVIQYTQRNFVRGFFDVVKQLWSKWSKDWKFYVFMANLQGQKST